MLTCDCRAVGGCTAAAELVRSFGSPLTGDIVRAFGPRLTGKPGSGLWHMVAVLWIRRVQVEILYVMC
jgi:hypothetical protein